MKARFAPVLADLLFVLLGSAQVWLSLRLPNGLGLSAAEPGPGLFPMLVGSLMAFAAAMHLCLNWRDMPMASPRESGSSLAIAGLVLSLAAYILLLPRIGFVLASGLLTVSTLAIYGMPGWGRRVGTAALITAVAELVFTHALGVTLPTATWFKAL